MATTKSQSDIAERRLRPVYDALDNMNNKQAIKLADNILKKQKDFNCAKALKALGLIRSGRTYETISIMEDIKESKEKLDEPTLQAITMCYKESNNPFGVMDIYNLAVQQSPKNEEFLSHLFMACVRVSEYSKQQQAAMNLYKGFPKSPYYFWAVMSTYMQAYVSLDMKKKSTFLRLAEKMIDKFMKEGKMEAEEEIRLYMMILEEQGKYEELLKLLQNEFLEKLKCVPNEKEGKEIEYLSFLERWPEVNMKCKLVLQKCPDDWSFYTSYFKSLLQLLKDDYTPDVSLDTENIQPDCTYDNAKSFIEKLETEHELLRGPLLAKIELLKKWASETNKGIDQDTLLKYLEEFFERFGSKPCCFTDIRQYTKLLNSECKKKLVEKCSTKIKEVDENAINKLKVKKLYEEICIECLQIQLELYKDLTLEEKFAKAKSYMRKYKESLKLGYDLNDTEPQYGDQLVMLASQLLLAVNKEKENDNAIWHIMLFLEESMESSQTNPHFKLLLIYLYSKIGAFGAVSHLIEDVDVKYIMFDSLGYFLTYDSYTSGQFQATKHLYDTSLNFYNANRKETPEQIIASYKYGSFRQIPDMINLKHRIETSYHHVYLMVESIYLDLMRYGNSIKEVNEQLQNERNQFSGIKFEDLNSTYLSDNRDFTIFDRFVSYDRKLVEERRKQSFETDILWLKYRYIILQGLDLCLSEKHSETDHITNGNHEDEKESSSINSLEKCLFKLKDIFKKTSDCSLDIAWPYPHQPPPSHIKKYEVEKYHEIILALFESISSIKSKDDIEEIFMNEMIENLKKVGDMIKEILSPLENSMVESRSENRMFNGKSLEKIVFWIETCFLTAVIISSLKKYMQDKFVGRKKKKKNTQQTSQCQPLLTFINELLTTLSSNMSSLLTRLYDIKEKYIDQTLDNVIEDLLEKTNSTTVTKVWQKIHASYQQSILELIQLVERKNIFIKTIAK